MRDFRSSEFFPKDAHYPSPADRKQGKNPARARSSAFVRAETCGHRADCTTAELRTFSDLLAIYVLASVLSPEIYGLIFPQYFAI
ncbi:MAG: hypothetical protein B6245_20940 [Desulfobacteraceae bacterium 4572_88]|nr:MAG: hypothetical protein B6245_20940 [Desulfobacteraceae bacterium 4572_88]RLC14260.1 MAG: hypothetical protein DRI57_14755 [Deltaproteobacteria bacterium]